MGLFKRKNVGTSDADAARSERSIAVLKKKGIPCFPQLPPVVPEAEARLRTPEEIARRLLAMFGVCVYSEARNSNMNREDALGYVNKINEILGGGLNDALTPEEKSYLAEEEPDRLSLVKFGWRYECCHVLMWALGFVERLGYPDDLCDVAGMATLLRDQVGLSGFLESAKPQNREVILDAADLILHYDWACVDARINGRESPVDLNCGVVVERHYAFNWLVGANDNADWDDISPDT
jgi:hypothetical protein